MTIMKIKGEYEIDILIQNMFNSYNFKTRGHNIVTDGGLDFILQCCVNQQNQHFGDVFVGTNGDEPTLEDTINTITTDQNKKLSNGEIVVANNQLTYTYSTTGTVLNGTREIGILSENKDVLITRDVHDRYDIPTDAQINLTYTLTISNSENKILENEEILND